MNARKILVDTDVLIDFLRRKEKAAKILDEASDNGDLYCSVITLAELYAGMRPAEKEDTEKLVAGMTILPVTESIARRGGRLRNDARPRNILLPDCLIAATALEEECRLLTFNEKDYPFSDVVLYGPTKVTFDAVVKE